MKHLSLLFAFFFITVTAFGQDAQRYVDRIFTEVDVQTDVVYGVNATVLAVGQLGEAVQQPLIMDVYTPVGDAEEERPLFLVFHTGNFLPFPQNGGVGGTLRDSTVVEICTQLAQRGFVAASVDYRLGWNPIAPDQTSRVFTLINAAWRGVQDANTAVRFHRMMAQDQGNPYGINSDKIALFGVGTGGYVSLNTSALDEYSEILLPKFTLDVQGTPVPMVIEGVNGNIEGTSVGVVDALSAAISGFPEGDTLCYPNHIGYSSEISMSINLGGAMGDDSWMDENTPPIISFQTPTDPFAPYECGTVVVPVVNLNVVEACGAGVVQQEQALYENNAQWVDFEFSDAYTQAAGVDNSLSGLYPVLVDSIVDSSPWDFWAEDNVNAPASAVMLDPVRARTYIDTIFNYSMPRVCLTMDLGCDLTGYNSTKEVINADLVGLELAPNPAEDMVNITSNVDSPILDVFVFDVNGRMLRSAFNINNNQYILQRETLADGMYYLQIRFEEGIATQKVILK